MAGWPPADDGLMSCRYPRAHMPCRLQERGLPALTDVSTEDVTDSEKDAATHSCGTDEAAEQDSSAEAAIVDCRLRCRVLYVAMILRCLWIGKGFERESRTPRQYESMPDPHRFVARFRGLRSNATG